MGGKVSTHNPGVGAGKFGLGLFQQSQPARRMMFKQLASALATGGRGMKMPFVQKAVASSLNAGKAALGNAAAGMNPATAGNVRGRILGRISRTNQQTAANIAPTTAATMIEQAPKVAMGAAPAAGAAYSTGISGQQAAVEASVARARAFSGMMAKIGQAFGYSQGDWLAGSGSPGAGSQGKGGPPAGTPNVEGRDAWVQRGATWTNTSPNPSYGAEFDVPAGGASGSSGGNWSSWLSKFSSY